jgi:hypothetical protein
MAPRAPNARAHRIKADIGLRRHDRFWERQNAPQGDPEDCCSVTATTAPLRPSAIQTAALARHYDGSTLSLRTRSGRECCEDFPELAAIAGNLGKHRVTLDGELVCLRDDARPDFAPLRRRLTGTVRKRHPVMFQTFDVLHLEGVVAKRLDSKYLAAGGAWPGSSTSSAARSGAPSPAFAARCKGTPKRCSSRAETLTVR